jgi:hypothetical protein
MPAQLSDVTSGWPFLVGPGRRRDFSTLLAPDFLVAERAHGVLTDLVSAPDAGTVTVLPITSLGGRRLTLVFSSHLVTAADLGNASAGGQARDEHSRPLRLAYGFVVPDVQIVAPAETDLAHALNAGLAVYRRFLEAEEDFTVRSSTGFRLRSQIVEPLPAAPAANQLRSGSAAPADPNPGRGGILLAGALLLGAAITGLLVQFGLIGGDPKTSMTPVPTATPSATLSPSATATTTADGSRRSRPGS